MAKIIDFTSNRLIVDDAINDDTSVVGLSQQKMDKLQFFRGDTVLLKGKKRHETVCIVLVDDTCPDDHIRMNRVVQNNLRVQTGDVVSIQDYQDIKYGKSIHVLPIDDTIEKVTEDLLEVYLKPYFMENHRPVKKGDVFVVRTVEFKVIETDPSPYCIVAPDTIIHCEGDPINRREEEENCRNEIDFEDIGGLEDVKQELLEFSKTSSRCILLYGPPGCGKTLLIKALANAYQTNLISTHGPELLAGMWGEEPEIKVRDLFNKAYHAEPCIISFDDLEWYGSARNETGNTTADRVLQQILTTMDSLSEKKNVFFVGVTNRPDIIDTNLFRPGRFNHIIHIPIPDEKSRLAIIKLTLRGTPLASDVDMNLLANVTEGYTSADLVEICRRACKYAIRECIEKEQQQSGETTIDLDEQNILPEIRQHHFEEALKFARRSVSANDIRKYEMFAETFRQLQFRFPDEQQSSEGNDDDDLYK